MKKVITLLLCLCMVLTLFTACGSKEGPETPAPGGSGEPSNNVVDVGTGGGSAGNEVVEADKYQEVFRIGGQMEFASLDIHENQSAYFLVTLTHDTLITETNGEFEPALATEWTQIDPTHWEFKLREGVTFHDGSPFTAEDVVFTFERGMASPAATMVPKFGSLEKVEAKDEYTVLFTLKSANQDFLLALSGGYASILSKTALANDPEGYKYGTGPYVTTDFKPSISATMELYEDFWGEMPKSKVMEYKYIVEDASRLVALRADEIDACISVGATDRAGLVEDDKLQAVKVVDGGTFFIGFDLRDPLLSDINLRKAICYAVNPEDVMIAAQEGYGQLTKSIWGTGCFGETDDLEGFYYDPELAKEYLAKSSYNGEPLSIMCAVKHFVDTATIVADFLREIGIETVIDERDFVGVVTASSPDSEPHQLLSWSTTWGNLPDHCRNFLADGVRTNYTCVSHPEAMELVDKALAETDVEARKELYRQIQQYMIDNALYLPLFHGVYYCAEALNVGGIKWSSDGFNHNFRYGCKAITE